ncbi:MAG: NTP transferase domain-containing protein [Nakamurella sp.]
MTLSTSSRARIAGVLLAAGMGRRFGGPKALADTGDGPWVLRALTTLAPLDERIVVVGAAADQVSALLPDGVVIADNPDFASGMGSSLIAGLRALTVPDAQSPARPSIAPRLAPSRRGAFAPTASHITVPVDAAIIMLVDLPDVPAAAIRRVVAEALRSATQRATESIENDSDCASVHGRSDGVEHEESVILNLRNTLSRATYRGVSGHPVLIGSHHFAGVIEAAVGDHGARDYLARHATQAVECGDLADGDDVDQ